MTDIRNLLLLHLLLLQQHDRDGRGPYRCTALQQQLDRSHHRLHRHHRHRHGCRTETTAVHPTVVRFCSGSSGVATWREWPRRGARPGSWRRGPGGGAAPARPGRGGSVGRRGLSRQRWAGQGRDGNDHDPRRRGPLQWSPAAGWRWWA